MDSGRWIPADGCRQMDSGRWIPADGFRQMDSGRWIPADGFRQTVEFTRSASRAGSDLTKSPQDLVISSFLWPREAKAIGGKSGKRVTTRLRPAVLAL